MIKFDTEPIIFVFYMFNFLPLDKSLYFCKSRTSFNDKNYE